MKPDLSLGEIKMVPYASYTISSLSRDAAGALRGLFVSDIFLILSISDNALIVLFWVNRFDISS
nr:hypothetical protein [Maribacter sp. ACAM166]